MSAVLTFIAILVLLACFAWMWYDIGRSDGYEKGVRHGKAGGDYGADMLRLLWQSQKEKRELQKQVMELNFMLAKREAK